MKSEVGEGMPMEALLASSRELFSICAMAAAMELIAGDGRAARPFRSVCALAAAVCALRMVCGLF